jgi:DNA-binding XRE family transcriptional regulator
MILLDNYTEIKREGNVYYITLPFSRDFQLLRFNFDVDNAEVEVDGKLYTVVDCLVSDNGEWINLVANRIFDEIEERKRIGRRIAELRKEQDMTQAQLAERCGIAQAHIARIETGRYSVGLDTLAQIATALGRSIDFVDV